MLKLKHQTLDVLALPNSPGESEVFGTNEQNVNVESPLEDSSAFLSNREDIMKGAECSEILEFSGLASDNCILKVSLRISEEAFFAVQFSSFLVPKLDEKLPNHCCPECHRNKVYDIAAGFFESKSEVLCVSPFYPDSSVDIKNKYVIEVREGLSTIMLIVRKVFNVRESEIILGMHLFEMLCHRHWQCSTFILLRNNLKLVFVVCLLIAHKSLADRVQHNYRWAELFNILLRPVNDLEQIVLRMLDYDVYNLSPSQYKVYEEIINGRRW